MIFSWTYHRIILLTRKSSFWIQLMMKMTLIQLRLNFLVAVLKRLKRKKICQIQVWWKFWAHFWCITCYFAFNPSLMLKMTKLKNHLLLTNLPQSSGRCCTCGERGPGFKSRMRPGTYLQKLFLEVVHFLAFIQRWPFWLHRVSKVKYHGYWSI